jgi:hypothetical protein
MDSRDASNDLKIIREIMDRTRRMDAGEGGWFMILWGIIWLLGFSGTQFAPGPAVGWIWLVLNTIGLGITLWLAIRFSRNTVRSSTGRVIFLWWASLLVFDGLVAWLFGFEPGPDVALLIVLTIGLGYVLFGLFAHWMISLVGALIAALAAGATVLMPNYLFLSIAIIGGGLLLGTGVWFVRQGK